MSNIIDFEGRRKRKEREFDLLAWRNTGMSEAPFETEEDFCLSPVELGDVELKPTETPNLKGLLIE